mmetsp:Transcript_23985/g.70758  ORF Transcript_23985/g.70758 Transcript_23985/m.70758 type:complete len:313 (-) Transcript_23985:69-1007(-)
MIRHWELNAFVLLPFGNASTKTAAKTGRQQPWTGGTSGLNCSFEPTVFALSPPTALASYPGCGSTVTRLLIELATSRWTGSIYGDKSLYNNEPHAFRGEMTTKSVIAVKTHYPSVGRGNILNTLNRSVLIVRDPHRALPSFGNWRFGKMHGSQHEMQAPEAWWETYRDKNFRGKFAQWVRQVVFWVGTHDRANRFTVVYEDLVDPGRALEALGRLASFLGVNTTEDTLKCAWAEAMRKNRTGIKRRTKYVPKFTPSQECFMTAELSKLEETLAGETEILLALRGYKRNVTDCAALAMVNTSDTGFGSTYLVG